jgi:hypothetical protein
MAIWYTYVYVVFWCIFLRFGMLYQEKSGDRDLAAKCLQVKKCI